MSGSRMPPASDKAQNLLKRFPFTDLSIAVARRGDDRLLFLRDFVSRGSNKSYQWTREAAAMIYCVQEPLFSIPPISWHRIESAIRNAAPPHNVDRNVEAAEALFGLVRPRAYQAYAHEPQDLRVGLLQRVSVNLRFYLVDGERLVFQYPQPRKSAAFSEAVTLVMGSIIHHAYATGDFADAEVEIADLSVPRGSKSREPRIVPIPRDSILSREDLNTQVEEVYEVLRSLVVEKPADAGPGGLI